MDEYPPNASLPSESHWFERKETEESSSERRWRILTETQPPRALKCLRTESASGFVCVSARRIVKANEVWRRVLRQPCFGKTDNLPVSYKTLGAADSLSSALTHRENPLETWKRKWEPRSRLTGLALFRKMRRVVCHLFGAFLASSQDNNLYRRWRNSRGCCRYLGKNHTAAHRARATFGFVPFYPCLLLSLFHSFASGKMCSHHTCSLFVWKRAKIEAAVISQVLIDEECWNNRL